MPIVSVRTGERGAVGEVHDAEVGDAQRSVLVEHEVRRLHVAVDDPAVVDVGQPRGRLAADLAHAVGRYRPAGEELEHARAAEQLHHEERPPVVVAGVEEPDEVRVVEGGEGAHLDLEPGPCSTSRRVLTATSRSRRRSWAR